MARILSILLRFLSRGPSFLSLYHRLLFCTLVQEVIINARLFTELRLCFSLYTDHGLLPQRPLLYLYAAKSSALHGKTSSVSMPMNFHVGSYQSGV